MLWRPTLHLLALATVAWLFSVIAQPDSAGVNVIRFGLKWFVYTYVLAASVYVLIPFTVLFAIAAPIGWLVARRQGLRNAYKIAFFPTVLWTVVGSFGNWYGHYRNQSAAQATAPSTAFEFPNGRDRYLAIGERSC